ncbi:hypothetical protein SprV_0602088500 [Sparganum proliferum]
MLRCLLLSVPDGYDCLSLLTTPTKALANSSSFSITEQFVALSEFGRAGTIRSNELAQRQDNLPASAAATAGDEKVSVGNRWCQLRVTVQSTALAVFGRARHQQQDSFEDSDAAISNLLAEKNRLHKAYVDGPTDDE